MSECLHERYPPYRGRGLLVITYMTPTDGGVTNAISGNRLNAFPKKNLSVVMGYLNGGGAHGTRKKRLLDLRLEPTQPGGPQF